MGYKLKFTDADGPKVIGCPGCGVPDRIARWWPEAHRKLAAALDERKKQELRAPAVPPESVPAV